MGVTTATVVRSGGECIVGPHQLIVLSCAKHGGWGYFVYHLEFSSAPPLPPFRALFAIAITARVTRPPVELGRKGCGAPGRRACPAETAEYESIGVAWFRYLAGVIRRPRGVGTNTVDLEVTFVVRAAGEALRIAGHS